MNAVDTNILLYVHDPRDARKQAVAESLVQSLANGALLWQVACEYVAASRKLTAFGFGPQDAWNDLRVLEGLWTIVLPQWEHLAACENLMKSDCLSFWDALLIAVARSQGITTLYTEDFGGVSIPGIQIIDPFLP